MRWAVSKGSRQRGQGDGTQLGMTVHWLAKVIGQVLICVVELTEEVAYRLQYPIIITKARLRQAKIWDSGHQLGINKPNSCDIPFLTPGKRFPTAPNRKNEYHATIP